MTRRAFFGRPEGSFVPGGAHVTVYLIPAYEGRLLVFDVAAREARGRWLPWDVLPWGGNPYVTASELADDWCEGGVSDLSLADILSFDLPGEGWELAIVFRAELTALPRGDHHRTPFLFERGHFDAIAQFDPVDLERWVTKGAGADGGDPASRGLVF